MKILICSKLFYPRNAIGAVRPTNFAKYLTLLNHNIVVVTEEEFVYHEYVLEGIEIIGIPNSIIIQRFKKLVKEKNPKESKSTSNPEGKFDKQGVKNSTFEWSLALTTFYRKSRRQIYSLIIELDWFIKSKRLVRKKFKKYHFDVVISSYGPIGSLILGYSIVRLKLARSWISDLRDNLINEDNPFWMNLLYRKVGRQIIKHAHSITLVSYGQKAMFEKVHKVKASIDNKIAVVSNGFEGNVATTHAKCNDGVLRIAYTGQLYSGKRDLTLLFHVIDDLVEEKKIDVSRIRFIYAGPNSEELRKQIKNFKNVESACEDLGSVSRQDAVDLQNRSNLLVALTWNTIFEQGILTGKVYEYLKANKPIIALTSGDLPDGELAKMVENLRLGIACEYLSYNADYKRLRNFLILQYDNLIEGRINDYSPDIDRIEGYKYENIVNMLNRIIVNVANV
jgi:hypothetical protein